MDFALDDAHETVRSLATEVLGGGSGTSAGRVAAAASGFDQARWAALAQAGLLGVTVPQSHGGAGLGPVAWHLLLVEAGRTATDLPLVHIGAALATLVAHGSEAQHDHWLPRLADGSARLTAALLDAGARRPEDLVTVAHPSHDGFRLEGEKILVGGAQDADGVVVAARAGEGVVAGIVDPRSQGVRGLTQRHVDTPVTDLVLNDVVLPAEAVLAGPGGGGSQVLHTLALHAAAGMASVAAGAAQGALALTAEHAAQREQFGRPLATFQAVSQRLADAFIDAEAMRLTALQAAWRLEAGLPATDAVLIAAWWANEAGDRVLRAAHHVHGGIGVDRGYPLHRLTMLLRRLEFLMGTATDHLETLGRRVASAPA